MNHGVQILSFELPASFILTIALVVLNMEASRGLLSLEDDDDVIGFLVLVLCWF